MATLFDDSLEFQVVLPALGIAHPSGYPFIRSSAFCSRCSCLSRPGRAVEHAFGTGRRGHRRRLLFRGTQKLAGNRSAAAVSAVVLAISPAWWSQATLAEVYALHWLSSRSSSISCCAGKGTAWAGGRRQEAGIRRQAPGSGQQPPTSTPVERAVQPPTSNLEHPTSSDLVWSPRRCLRARHGAPPDDHLVAAGRGGLHLLGRPAPTRRPRRWLKPFFRVRTAALLSLSADPRPAGDIAGRVLVPTLAGTLARSWPAATASS